MTTFGVNLTDGRRQQSSAIIEVRQYLEEPNTGRHEDPLVWRKGRVSVYPRLSAMAQWQLSIVASHICAKWARVFEKWPAYLGEAQSANRKERPDGHVSERKYWEMLTTVAVRHKTQLASSCFKAGLSIYLSWLQRPVLYLFYI